MTLVTSKANPIWHFKKNTAGPRRIVHVPPRFASKDWSGTDAEVLALAKQQLTAGMEPIIITTMMLSDIRHEIVGGIRVHRHPHSYYFFGSGETEPKDSDGSDSSLLSIPVFQSLMQEPEVRLFHSHATGRLGSEVRNAARMRLLPFVVTVHEEAGSGSRKDLEDADMVIFEDKAEAKRVAALLGHNRIGHLSGGVDCARFAKGHGATLRALEGIPEDAFVAGHLRPLETEQMTWLLGAFAQAAAERPDLHLVLSASDQESDAATLSDLIQKHTLGERVHLLTQEENHDTNLVDALHACDAVVAFTQNDVLEAWSAGKPVIAGRTDALATLVTDHETGLFFEPESPLAAAELVAYLERLESDKDLRRQLGDAGRKQALAQHDWMRVHARLEEIYQLAEKHHQSKRPQQVDRRAA